MEGSQEVKQAQRQFRDELLNGPDPVKATKDASVVVTNPTHLAVGIRYDAEEWPLPRIVVAGADNDARLIRETAHETGATENLVKVRIHRAKEKLQVLLADLRPE